MHPLRACLFGILLWSAATLTSCSTKRPQNIDPLLSPYVESFEARYGISYQGDAIIKVLEESKAGVCTVSSGSRVIVINQIYFDRYSTSGLEELMYHELGHCALGLNHNNNKDQYGCPTSIMFYAAFGNSWCYIDRREVLLQELENMWKNSFGN